MRSFLAVLAWALAAASPSRAAACPQFAGNYVCRDAPEAAPVKLRVTQDSEAILLTFENEEPLFFRLNATASLAENPAVQMRATCAEGRIDVKFTSPEKDPRTVAILATSEGLNLAMPDDDVQPNCLRVE